MKTVQVKVIEGDWATLEGGAEGLGLKMGPFLRMAGLAWCGRTDRLTEVLRADVPAPRVSLTARAREVGEAEAVAREISQSQAKVHKGRLEAAKAALGSRSTESERAVAVDELAASMARTAAAQILEQTVNPCPDCQRPSTEPRGFHRVHRMDCRRFKMGIAPGVS